MARFRCPACGHNQAVRVVVPREGRTDYVTEFLACRKCRVMQWVPPDEERGVWPAAPDFGKLWGGR